MLRSFFLKALNTRGEYIFMILNQSNTETQLQKQFA